MRRIIQANSFLVLLTILGFQTFAQSDEASIKETVNNMFSGMKKSDTAMIRSAFSSKPILQTILKNKEGKVKILSESVDSFLVSVGTPHNEIYDERITFDVIKIDGELAIVWAPYKFYLGEKFHHCGVDSFQMIKENGVWKIQYLVDTRRLQNCE